MVSEAVGGTGSLLMDGTEQNLFTLLQTKFLGGYIDLSPLIATETIVIRQYIQIKSGGSLIKSNEQTKIGLLTKPLLEFPMKPNGHGFRVTLQQTSGTFRTIDFEFFEV